MKTISFKYIILICFASVLCAKTHAQAKITTLLDNGGNWYFREDFVKIDDDNTGTYAGILFNKPNGPDSYHQGFDPYILVEKAKVGPYTSLKKFRLGMWGRPGAIDYYRRDPDGIFFGGKYNWDDCTYIDYFSFDLLTGYTVLGQLGNVGIGTDAPSAKLDVYNTTANARTSIFTRGEDANYQLGFQNGSGNGANDVAGRLALSYNGGATTSSINFHRGWYDWDSFISVTVRKATNPALIIGTQDQTNPQADKNIFMGGFAPQEGADYARTRQWATTFIKSGLDIGTDNATTTSLTLDVHGSAHFNNDLGTTDATMTKVSINTDTYVPGCALTVAGPTYIGDWRTIEQGAINTDYINTYNLWVDKGIVSPEYRIASANEWADDVFEPEYNLPSLKEVEQYVSENGHLHGVPSAKEVKENGYSVGKLNTTLLRKVEELTVYAIAMEKRANSLQEQLNELNDLKAELKELKAGLQK